VTTCVPLCRFSSLDKAGKGHLTREDFLRIPELAINPLGDRIVHAFFYESKNGEEDKVDFKVGTTDL
jgi:calcineurin B family protein 1